MELKLCNKCNIEKSLDDFYYRKNRNRYESTCTPCYSKAVKEKRNTNEDVKNKSKESCKKYNDKNKEKLRLQQKEYYEENKDKLKNDMKGYYQANKDKALSYAKDHRQELKEKIKNGEVEKPDIIDKTCTKCHKNKNISEFTFRKTRNVYDSVCKKCNMIRERDRRVKNIDNINARRRQIKKPKTIQQKIRESLRRRLNGLVKNRGQLNLYNDLLGCNLSFLMEWFEYVFDLDNHLNMSWSNYGEKWQIDHVIPCVSFDLTIKENQKRCFHWTNLCPVLKAYNLAKQAKIVHVDIIQQISRVRDFTNGQYSKTQNQFINVQKP